jgi:hypothetical protein
MGFSYRLELTPNRSNCLFNFYLDRVKIGHIIFHITYHEISIGWVTIIGEYRKGYGSKMMELFEKYVTKFQSSVTKIVLIPKGFDGNDKNYLCTFYEKNGYTQEKLGKPFYIKNIVRTK